VFDDVVRKEKPKEEAFQYKKRLTLDHEKSKLSLAQIYEQEFLKQAQVGLPPLTPHCFWELNATGSLGVGTTPIKMPFPQNYNLFCQKPLKWRCCLESLI